MASPAKKDKVDDTETTVSGYLHTVSDIKLSKKNQAPYFNFLVQTTREEFHRGVAFSPEKHVSFQQAASQKSPVKLRHVRKSLNFTADSFEIVVSRGSRLEVADVGFQAKTPTGEKAMTVADVAELTSHHNVGEICVKVVRKAAASKVISIRGTEMEMRECWVADHTGQVKLHLWDQQIAEVNANKSYTIKNVATRMNEGIVNLACTRATVFVDHEDLNVPEDFTETEDQDPELMVVYTAISAVCLADKRVCKLCGGRQTAFACKTKNYCCEGCKLLQRSNAYVPNISGTIILVPQDNRTIRLTMPMSVLKTYLQETFLTHLMADVQDVEEHFIDGESFEVHYNMELIVTSIRQNNAPKEGEAQRDGGDSSSNKDNDDFDNIDVDALFQ